MIFDHFLHFKLPAVIFQKFLKSHYTLDAQTERKASKTLQKEISKTQAPWNQGTNLIGPLTISKCRCFEKPEHI